ncbi:MAG: glycosyltransferase [Planctomycetes bacterium]|nr:glycosyltransferase [Planctomycetota bacterium]
MNALATIPTVGVGGNDARRDLTVVVPVHDDKVEFEAILREYGREFERRGIFYEFVFVLDGTPDRLFEELAARRPPGVSVRLIKFNQPFGESIALAAGFKIARGLAVLTLPQYLQTDPADVHKVLDALKGGADVVTCWRVPRVDPWLNRVQSTIFNSVMRLLTRTRVHDLNCLMRAMVRRVFEDVSVQGDMYRFLPVLAFRAGYEVAEVKVRHLKETGKGALPGSLFGAGVYLRRVLDIAALIFLTRFTRKPLRFFGLAGGGIFAVGLLTCLVLLVEFILGGDDPSTRLKNRAWLIFGALMIVLGVQTFFIGLVAEIVIFTQARHLKDYKVGRVSGSDGEAPAPRDPPGDSGPDDPQARGPRLATGRPDESSVLLGPAPKERRGPPRAERGLR